MNKEELVEMIEATIILGLRDTMHQYIAFSTPHRTVDLRRKKLNFNGILL